MLIKITAKKAGNHVHVFPISAEDADPNVNCSGDEMMKHNQDVDVIANEIQIEQAEARVEAAEAWTEQVETRSELAIKASELRYRRLFEAAKDGILILDIGTGRITDVNPFLFKLLGFTRDEMIGKTVGELSPFKDIESNKVMLDRLQKDGYVHYEDLPLEARDGRHIAR